MKSYWVIHKGKRVFIANFSNFDMDSAALAQECDYIISELQKEPLGSVLSITNAEGTVASPANLNVFKNMLPRSNKFIRRRVVIGVDGPRRAFINLINKLTGGSRFLTFDNMEQALEWITRD
jgi:hypothetical protein